MAYKQPNRYEVAKLIDLLRKMLVYQTPQPVFSESATPDYMLLKFKPAAYNDIMRIIVKAGGWVLSDADKKVVEEAHNARAKKALGNGTDFDFDGLSVGDLYEMHEETGSDPELKAFHEAIADEIHQRGPRTRNGEVKC